MYGDSHMSGMARRPSHRSTRAGREDFYPTDYRWLDGSPPSEEGLENADRGVYQHPTERKQYILSSPEGDLYFVPESYPDMVEYIAQCPQHTSYLPGPGQVPLEANEGYHYSDSGISSRYTDSVPNESQTLYCDVEPDSYMIPGQDYFLMSNSYPPQGEDIYSNSGEASPVLQTPDSTPENRRAGSKLSNASIHSNFSEDSLMQQEAFPCEQPKLRYSLPTIAQDSQEDMSGSQVSSEGRPLCKDNTVIVPKGPNRSTAWWEAAGDDMKTGVKKHPPLKKLSVDNSSDIDGKGVVRGKVRKGTSRYMEEMPLKEDEEEMEMERGSTSLPTPNMNEGQGSLHEGKKPSPTAFTVDIGAEGPTKKLDLGDSISKFVPKHRRTLSSNRPEDKEEEKEEGTSWLEPLRSPSVGRKKISPASKSPPSTQVKAVPVLKTRKNESPLETRSTRKPPIRESKSVDDGHGKGKPVQHKDKKLPKTPSGKGGKQGGDTVNGVPPLNESASYLINRMLNSMPDGDAMYSDDLDAFVTAKCAEVPHSPKKTSIAETFVIDCKACPISGELLLNLKEVPVEEEVKEVDNVSEAGTYTIEKDENCPDEEEARKDIDKVFGVGDEGEDLDDTVIPEEPLEVALNLTFQVKEKDAHLQDRRRPKTLHLSSSPPQGKMSPPSQSSPSSSPTSKDRSVTSPSKLSSSQESQSRPRRLLPTPPAPKNGIPNVAGLVASAVAESKRKESSYAPGQHSDSSLETESYLRDTESVVTAMQARVEGRSVDHNAKETKVTLAPKSASAQHGATNTVESHKPVARVTKGHIHANPAVDTDHSKSSSPYSRECSVSDSGSVHSDSSSGLSESLRAGSGTDAHSNRYNRAYKLRKAQTTYDSEGGAGGRTRVAEKKSKTSLGPDRKSNGSGSVGLSQSSVSSDAAAKGTSTGFGRNDGGRFSLRLKSIPGIPAKGSKPPSARKAPSQAATKPPVPSSKEEEFKNWQRRKKYDPLKAAAEGRKKEAAKRNLKDGSDPMTQSAHGALPNGTVNGSPFVLSKSASFHGQEQGVTIISRSIRHRQPAIPEVSSVSPSPPPPNYPHQIPEPQTGHDIMVSRSMSHVPASFHNQRHVPSPVSEDYDEPFCDTPSPTRKVSMDEGVPRSPVSGRHVPGSPIMGHRNKGGKLEALDSLVISTISSLSTKLVGSAQGLLEKLKNQLSDETDVASKIEDLLVQLEAQMQPGALQGQGSPSPVEGYSNNSRGSSSSARTLSRDLSGTLKNLKRLQQALAVVDEVLSMDPTADDDLVQASFNGYHSTGPYH